MDNKILKLLDENFKCSCKGYNLDKLLQPNILIILAEQNMHGYMLIQELERRNIFEEEKADNTGVYRTLRTLEDRELVAFEWVLDEAGPAKKNYMITDKGFECLKNWISSLQVYKKKIDKIIKDAEQVFIKQ
ncbi:PadR family transcriptional regulator [Tissierella creatinini]|nr:PadR family transcriptional regulator [Tissierella creatinini]TJX64661.1 PadR family transcriptional regulator [Soehngenia saccharolytica]